MDDFNTIRLRRKTLEEFKEYSIKTGPNYSETLEYMIAFFKDTGLSPYDTMTHPIFASTIAINRRLDYIIALLKNMEQTQLIPTREMLERLFEGIEKPEPVYIERSQEEIEASRLETEKLRSKYSNEIYYTKEELKALKRKFENILRKVVYVDKTFGKGYYHLDISKEEFEDLKTEFFKI
ncbi:BfmA/BtgA family mobilization protein [Flagellimonas pacifica]|uniref:Uncharacterized protein n=1 Tax=Flagellimonas pacifica TaxID=1247520 RepID=A0A285MQX5_9FLAO|nr:BfmA/BtgA family mobilization protein [Allomuricauda parva]SNY99565.1 hypothetical protein SAMN06265377_1376 [Allomuricauda parva]